MTTVRMEGITKRFPGVVANDGIDLELEEGEVHALLGENGSGKTTLMSILYGLWQPDEGQIWVDGERVAFASPRDAIRRGISMVHQDFMLVPPLTVIENVILGAEPRRGYFTDLTGTKLKIEALSAQFGLKVNPQAKIWQLSVGEQQPVEIIKALYRGASVLVMDEPTSVLTPQETHELFQTLRIMARQGHTIVFITHKLREVMEVSDRVTVLRNGKHIGSMPTKETTERELARLMVGRDIEPQTNRKDTLSMNCVLEVKDLHVLNDRGLPALRGLALECGEGEILGIAGVDGNGQTELAEAITGLRRAVAGQVLLNGQSVTDHSPGALIERGVAHIPADRKGVGTILEFDLANNLILHSHRKPPMSKLGLLRRKAIRQHADQMVQSYDIRCSSVTMRVKLLSGGNLQKVVLARELARSPRLIVAAHPTRGLDIGATEYVHSRLLEHRDKGAAILLISADLDEILALSDRINVIYEGRIVGKMERQDTRLEELGMMMAGLDPRQQNSEKVAMHGS